MRWSPIRSRPGQERRTAARAPTCRSRRWSRPRPRRSAPRHARPVLCCTERRPEPVSGRRSCFPPVGTLNRRPRRVRCRKPSDRAGAESPPPGAVRDRHASLHRQPGTVRNVPWRLCVDATRRSFHRMSLEGRHLGRYRLLEPLGSGGMSVVYRGLDTSLQREVAVKVLHPHLARQKDARARLAREARAVARLQHPNILEVFDFADPSAEDAFLVTELVRGETLKSFAERERLFPPELAALVIQQLARALGHAHEAGVIHRDLKPENVMVRDDGVLKLMDFGIARVLDPAERMTVTGALVGSPAYMAPEVIDGEPATPESDVFSLGTLLYWLWTGTLPFAAPTTPATLKRILAGTYEDPRGVCPAISDSLVGILDRCLAHAPADRFASARQLEVALSEALEELGLGDGEAVLGAFFADPGPTRAALVERLVAALLARGAEEAAEGRLPRALARVDQALALQPDAPAARALLDRLQASLRRGRLVRRTGVLAASAVGLAGLVAGGLALVRHERRPTPVAAVSSAPAPS